MLPVCSVACARAVESETHSAVSTAVVEIASAVHEFRRARHGIDFMTASSVLSGFLIDYEVQTGGAHASSTL
jgi:hypothetical protein